METEDSLPRSHKPSTGRSSETKEYTPRSRTLIYKKNQRDATWQYVYL